MRARRSRRCGCGCASISAPTRSEFLDELLEIDSSILVDILSREPGGQPTEDEMERLWAVFAGPRAIELTEAYLRYTHDEERRAAFFPADELGVFRWETRRLTHVEADCIVVIGRQDQTEMAREPFAEEESAVVALARIPDDRLAEVSEINPTPWRIHDATRLIFTETSEPVPEVVGIATNLALLPRRGYLYIRLRMSRNFCFKD
jgi:hypothetical protein